LKFGQRKNVLLFLSALAAVLTAEGCKTRPGALEAAMASYDSA